MLSIQAHKSRLLLSCMVLLAVLQSVFVNASNDDITSAFIISGDLPADTQNRHTQIHSESTDTDPVDPTVSYGDDGSMCDTCALYNLKTDPTEDSNLLLLTDASQWDDTIRFFDERVSYWTQFFDTPYIVDPDTSNWDTVGCAPWENTDFMPLEIEQKYSYAEAPHIIFVLVDDWGWNDLGARSTFMNWTTPHIDSLFMNDALQLTNYYSNELCTPTRGSLLTGRYAFRIGFQNGTNENNLYSQLGLDEVTIAQELQSAGYKTYLVGKWDVGFQTPMHLPNNRGFDYFYGYYNGVTDYYTKSFGSYLDLHENGELVTNEAELDTTYHAGYLYEAKAEEVLRSHSESYPGVPMFLYYAMQLVHSPYEAPEKYMERCGVTSSSSEDDYTISDAQTYCAMNTMLDEALANLTCVLTELGMNENSVLVISSDNGGDHLISGNSYPFHGQKGSCARGGVSSTAMIISDLLPESMRGTEYPGTMHVTDWLPTLMHIATDGEWSGSYSGQELDGVDMWDAIVSNAASPRIETVHVLGDTVGTYTCILYDDMKYIKTYNVPEVSDPVVYFSEDQAPENAVTQCVLTDFLVTPDESSAAKKAASAVMQDVVQSVTEVSYRVSLTAIIGLSFALVVMFAVKNMFDRHNAVDKISQSTSPVKTERASLFADDVKIADGYGSIKSLCHGP